VSSQCRADQLTQRLPSRGFDTRAGTVQVAIPKLREGSYFRAETIAPTMEIWELVRIPTAPMSPAMIS
jgi:hypothetical protein